MILELDRRSYRHVVHTQRGEIRFVVEERVGKDTPFSADCFDLRDGRTLDSDNCHYLVTWLVETLDECSAACAAKLAELLAQPAPVQAEQLEANR